MRSSVTAAAPSSPDARVNLRIERVPFGHPDAVRLVAEVQQEYVVRYGGMDETPLDPVMFDPPRGSFYVGYVDDQPLVSGAWRRREDVEALGISEVRDDAERGATRTKVVGARLFERQALRLQ